MIHEIRLVLGSVGQACSIELRNNNPNAIFKSRFLLCLWKSASEFLSTNNKSILKCYDNFCINEHFAIKRWESFPSNDQLFKKNEH